jgi:hypothetical protein
MRGRVLVTLLLVAVACSQRVTPEEEYAAWERERPLMPASQVQEIEPGAEPGAGSDEAVAVTVEWPGPPDAQASSSDVLFVFARQVGVSSGPPLAVRRIPAPTFPARIEIGSADAMIPGTRFPDRVSIQARLDRDGDASTAGSDDWAGTSEPVAPGGEVRLVLARIGTS